MFVLPLTRSTVPASYRVASLPHRRTAIDRLFDDSFDRFFGAAPASRTPAMDVTETDSAFTVTLEVPGVSRAQLNVSVLGRRVSIESVDVAPTAAAESAETAAKSQGNTSGGNTGGGTASEGDRSDASEGDARTSAPSAPKKEVRVLYRERVAAKFARTVSLPAEVDETSSQARFDNGVLTLTLAKKVPTGATQLRIV